MNQKFFFIVNPIAGDIDKSIVFEQLEFWRKEYNADINTYETIGRDDVFKIEHKIGNEKPVLIAVGGDGTLKMTAEIALKHDLTFAQIPAGSANGMARELGIPNISFGISTIAKRQLNELFEAYIQNKVFSIDAVFINGELMLHIADFGINANLVRDFGQSDTRGFSAYLKTAFDHLTDIKPFQYSLTEDGQVRKGKSVMLAIANAKRYGTGAVINPGGRLDDGFFELISIKDITIKNSFQSLLSILTDEADYDPEQIEIWKFKNIRLEIERPVAFQIDGEYLGDIDVAEISIQPKALNILKP